MKLTAIAAVVAVAGIAQVTGTPIDEGAHALRVDIFGSPIPYSGSRIPIPRPLGPGLFHTEWTDEGPKWVQDHPTRMPPSSCMTRLRQKGNEIYHAFRKAIGLSHTTYDHVPVPVYISDMQWRDCKALAAGRQPHLTNSSGLLRCPNGTSNHPSVVQFFSRLPHHHNHHGMHVHRVHGPSFSTRLHYSLMNLGRWEGRAVAFVLGCGIGVLLRMFWVLAIVTYRAMPKFSHITIVEEYDETSIQAPPPTYSYPVDEKVDVKEDVAKAPATAEESN